MNIELSMSIKLSSIIIKFRIYINVLSEPLYHTFLFARDFMFSLWVADRVRVESRSRWPYPL